MRCILVLRVCWINLGWYKVLKIRLAFLYVGTLLDYCQCWLTFNYILKLKHRPHLIKVHKCSESFYYMLSTGQVILLSMLIMNTNHFFWSQQGCFFLPMRQEPAWYAAVITQYKNKISFNLKKCWKWSFIDIFLYERSAFVQYWKGPFTCQNRHLQGEGSHI